MLRTITFALALGIVALGCDKSSSTTPSGTTAAPTPAPTVTAEDHHDHIPIGESTQAGLKLVATTEGLIKAAGGGEGAFEVTITGGKPKSVRFWVGTEDAKGSAKAKAAEESPNAWHAHLEVPNPLPTGSKFWVEVEPPTGETFKASFDLKVQ